MALLISGQVTEDAVAELLVRAKEAGISWLDTAQVMAIQNWF